MSGGVEARFSVSEITTFRQTFAQDLATYREAGARGIGIWEFKLRGIRDGEAVAALRDSGLEATTCVPDTLSIYPVPLPGPRDPEVRTRELCAAIERLAAFRPAIVLCLTGHPGATPADEAQRVVVDGLRRAARVAAEHGIVLGLEPLHRELYRQWTIVSDIPRALALIADVGEPSLRLLYDVYNLWDTDGAVELTRRHAREFASSVHVCDRRADTRNEFDRALPGDGVIDLPALLGALDEGGFEGWFDLEIFSDDGTFGDLDFEDSLWKLDPLEVVKRARESLLRAWQAR